MSSFLRNYFGKSREHKLKRVKHQRNEKPLLIQVLGVS